MSRQLRPVKAERDFWLLEVWNRLLSVQSSCFFFFFFIPKLIKNKKGKCHFYEKKNIIGDGKHN